MANKSKDPAAQRWLGALEGMHDTRVYGWAVDLQNPQARVIVEICINGEPIDCVAADVARSDLAQLDTHCEDHCHGFIGKANSVSGEASLTARVANTGFFLAGQIQMAQPQLPPASALNRVFSDGGLRLLGWASDPLEPGRTCRVRAYDGAQCVAEAVADQEHPAMRGQMSGRHGFTIDLPLALADGHPHTIRVTDEAGLPVNGSPVSLCCYPAGPASLLGKPEDSPLLATMLASFQANLPRSLGWQHYAHWAEHFAPSAPPPMQPLPMVAVIVTGCLPQDRQAAASLAGLRQQAGVDCHVIVPDESRKVPVKTAAKTRRTTKNALETTSGTDFSHLLQQAMDSGAQWIACVRAGDCLAPNALALALEAGAQPDAEILYSDSESTQQGKRWPWFKPAWNPEYALATDYPLQLMLIRRSVILSLPRQGQDLANCAQLAWQALTQVWQRAQQAIVHIPQTLYHFRSALSAQEREERDDAARAALAVLEPGSSLTSMPPAPEIAFDGAARRLCRSIGAQRPRVSLIIPTRDQATMLQACIDSLLKCTKWPDLEIIVIDNDSSQAKTRTYLRKLEKQGIRVLPMPGNFNFARINNRAVAAATGDIIGLINNDIQALHEGWLEEMSGHLLQGNVGAVGAKLLWPNEMVQHGGIVLGMGNVAGHYGNMLHDEDWGDHARNRVALQVSGVTAACLLMRKADYEAIGGMDEVAFPVAFNDVDLCLRLRAMGKAIVWTPFAKLLHAESASRGKEDTPQKQARARRELEQLHRRWGTQLLHDPFYHPCLNLDAHSQPFTGLAVPPRRRAPRQANLITDGNE
jgi:GT2 family glycosyltransferase